MRSLSTTLGSTAQGIWMGKMHPHNIWLWKPMGLYVQASCRAVGNWDSALEVHAHNLTHSKSQQRGSSFENCQSYTRMRCWLISGHVPHVQDSVRMFSGHRNTGGHHFFCHFSFTLLDQCCQALFLTLSIYYVDTAHPTLQFPWGLTPPNQPTQPRAPMKWLAARALPVGSLGQHEARSQVACHSATHGGCLQWMTDPLPSALRPHHSQKMPSAKTGAIPKHPCLACRAKPAY